MVKLVVGIEKARRDNPKLILRTDLPYTRNGKTFYRSGYVLPADAKKLDDAKNGPVGGSVAVNFIPDMFDASYDEVVAQELKALYLVGSNVQAPGVSGKLEAIEPHIQDGELLFMMKINGKWVPETKVEVIPETDDKRIKEVLQNVTPETRADAQLALFGGAVEPELKPEKVDFKPSRIQVDAKYSPKYPYLDFYDIDEDKINLVPEKGILDNPRPSWIPEIDERSFRWAQYRIEFSRIPDTQNYLILTGNEQGENMVVAPLHIVAATQDYYMKREKAINSKKAKDKNDNLIKVFEDWKKLKEEFEKTGPWTQEVYQKKRDEKNLGTVRRYGDDADDENEFVIEDIVRNYRVAELNTKRKYKAHPIRSLAENRATTDNINLNKRLHGQDGWGVQRNQIRALKQKLSDMECLYEDWESSFGKGRETAYGDKGTVKDLVESVGVRVKRQNGDEVDKGWLDGVKQSMTELYSIFGDRSEMAKNWGLKISCAADKMQHARKAIGIFFPRFRAIGVTGAAKSKDFGFTLAHEFGHFMDYYVGHKKGRNYASDDYYGPTAKIVSAFRGNMKTDGGSKYWNRTCEVFARSMEQYFAEKTNDKNYDKKTWYCNSEAFNKYVAPAIEDWLRDNDSLLKSIGTKGVSIFNIGN